MRAIAATRLLVISPHLDDAALSVGATIAHRTLRGYDTEVVTVFSGPNPIRVSPAASQFHQECGLGNDAMAVRRHEDAVAMSILGANQHYLPYLDAIYRRERDGGWLCQHRRQMFEISAAREQALVTDVSEGLAALAARIRPDLVMTCAGFGGHIDHAVVREATEHWATREHFQFLVWEDLPYMLGGKARIPLPGRPAPSKPPPEAWKRKWKAIRAYSSQISMLWPREQAWQDELVKHARAGGGGRATELLWIRDPLAGRVRPRIPERGGGGHLLRSQS